jgi:hypothetical protein
MGQHDLTSEISEGVARFGYTAYCYVCGYFFKDWADADTTECRPLPVDPRQEMPR